MKNMILAAALAVLVASPAFAQQKFEITLSKDGWHVGKVTGLEPASAQYCAQRGGTLRVDHESPLCKVIKNKGKEGLRCPNVCDIPQASAPTTPPTTGN